MPVQETLERARYYRAMAVQVFSNNLPNPVKRAAVVQAVLNALGSPSGDWKVQIHENQNSPSWHITLWGPNDFHWTREFFGPEEQDGSDDYSIIRMAVSRAVSSVRLSVFVSYAQPDGSEGFVLKLTEALRQELLLQTGEPAVIDWDIDRLRLGATWPEQLVDRIQRASVLVPVMSPSYFKSSFCRREYEVFTEKRESTAHTRLAPVYFLTTTEIKSAHSEPRGSWFENVARQRFFDFRLHRFDLTSMKARREIASLAAFIRRLHADVQIESGSHRSAETYPPTEPAGPIYVNSIHLENFRGFDKLDINLNRESALEGRWTCIAGINGTGKSTVLQALSVALLGYPLAVELGGERLNRMRRLIDRARETAKVTVNIVDSQSDSAPPPQILTLEIRDEGRIVFDNFPPVAPPVQRSWDRLRRAAIAGYGATRNLSPRTDSSSENLSSDVRHHITLFDPLSQLVGGEYLLGKQTQIWPFLDLLKNALQRVFGEDLKVILDDPPAGIRFTVANSDDIEAIDLADGFRSAAAWIADLCSLWCEKAPHMAMSADPGEIVGIVLIDEIDLHLHPSLQRSLVPRLRQTFQKVQWIVTTHSPLVLANFDANEIVALERDSDGNVRQRQLDRQILSFTSNEIYEWLMGTSPTGAALEEETMGLDSQERAVLMRASPTQDEAGAKRQVDEFREILRALKH